MAEKKYKIIGVGSPIVDSLAHVDEAFIDGIAGAKGGMELVDSSAIGELMAKLKESLVQAPGGSAGNTIFAKARLGLSTTFLGKIGNDVGGVYFKERYLEMGGDVSRFKTGDIPNGRCLSLITPDSERTMRTDLGAAMTLSPDEVSVEDFLDCQHAHIEGYLLFNRDLMYKVLDSAKKAGCTISVDLASFEVVNATKDIIKDILTEYVDIIFANEEEAEAFGGSDKDHPTLARELAECCSIAVVKVGADGSYICTGETCIKVDANAVEKVVDTTGAGDFWAAGFLYAWLTERPLEDCGRFGSLLGAEVVQVIGAALPEERWDVIKTAFSSPLVKTPGVG